MMPYSAAPGIKIRTVSLGQGLKWFDDNLVCKNKQYNLFLMIRFPQTSKMYLRKMTQIDVARMA